MGLTAVASREPFQRSGTILAVLFAAVVAAGALGAYLLYYNEIHGINPDAGRINSLNDSSDLQQRNEAIRRGLNPNLYKAGDE